MKSKKVVLFYFKFGLTTRAPVEGSWIWRQSRAGCSVGLVRASDEVEEWVRLMPNSSIDFNDTTDEINIDEFLIDNFIHDSSGRNKSSYFRVKLKRIKFGP